MFRPGIWLFLCDCVFSKRGRSLPITRSLGLLLLAGLPVLLGCSQTPEGVAEVTGTVTMDQEPLSNAVVTFIPVEGGRPSTGKTDESGAYRLVYTREAFGALTGEHDVEISTLESQGEEIVPNKYNSKSQLTETVEPGSNEIDFDLTTQ